MPLRICSEARYLIILVELLFLLSVAAWNAGRITHHRHLHRSVSSTTRRFSESISLPKSDAVEFQSMELPMDPDEYSLRKLQEYAAILVSENLERGEDQKASICLVIAGGGGNAISTLAATPGASSILLEGCVTYDRKSYQTYVRPPTDLSNFRYASEDAAKLASKAALRKALRFRSTNLKLMAECIGIGCASQLQSSDLDDNPHGHGHVVVTKADGSQLVVNVTLAHPGKPGTARSRFDDDVFMSHIILRSIGKMNRRPSSVNVKQAQSLETDFGDTIAESWTVCDSAKTQGTSSDAARRIISGEAEAVILLPVYENDVPTSFQALEYTVLPCGSLVFPGSFNPPHDGHMLLAQAAIQHSMNNQANLPSYQKNSAVLMELSIMNADKPTIDPEAVSERVDEFLKLKNLPKEWGILLTKAPLFSEKMRTLQKYIPKDDLDILEENKPTISFLIGTDTLVRLLDPKYYDDDRDTMLEALRCMMTQGVRFVVGGRLEQRKDSTGSKKFVSGFEDVRHLPEDIKNMFSIIKEEEFRVDISSSEIRAGARSN